MAAATAALGLLTVTRSNPALIGHFSNLLKNVGRTTSLMARAAPLSCAGIVLYRGPYFGIFDTLKVPASPASSSL